MVRKMRQYCRFNFNFHADDIRISSCLKNEIKFFSLVDILQEINKKDPQYIFLHRLEQPLNGTTLYTAVNLQKSYERPDFTPTHSVFPKQLPSEIHIMFSVSDSFKGNFDGVHFNKAPLPSQMWPDSLFNLSMEESEAYYFITQAYLQCRWPVDCVDFNLLHIFVDVTSNIVGK